MGGDDLQIVRKVLGVLHDVDEIDVGHPDYEKIQIDRDFDGSFVLEYDLRRTPSVQLPSQYCRSWTLSISICVIRIRQILGGSLRNNGLF